MEEITKEISLHLFVTAKCTNNCPLCCNREYNIKEIPVVQVDELAKAGTLCITGGEPLLFINKVSSLIDDYRYINPKEKKVYIYTSGCNTLLKAVIKLSDKIDGFSIGPKSFYDWSNIEYIFEYLSDNGNIQDKFINLNNRLYIFPEWKQTYLDIAKENPLISRYFDVIDRKWQNKFKPAKNSIFRRLPITFNVNEY